MPRKENIRRPVHAIRNSQFVDSIKFSDSELETMTEQDIAEFIESKALAYSDFVVAQSDMISVAVTVEDDG